MALNVHVVTQSQNHRLNLSCQLAGWRQHKSLGVAQGGVDGLKHRNAKGGRFTGTRLRLRDHITSADDGQNGTLLDRGWLLEVCESERRESSAQ